MKKQITGEFLEKVSGGTGTEKVKSSEYAVKFGDTLESIAIKNHTTVAVIKAMNSITDIKAGQIILIPE